MINLPDEIRLGAPDEHDERDEIHVEHFRIWRDEHEGRRTQDIELELGRRQHHRLRKLLHDNAEAERLKIVFDVPTVVSTMPPDPMGPAYFGAVQYITALSPQPSAVPDPLTAEYCLQQMMVLRGIVQGGFSNIDPPGMTNLSIPQRPDNITLPGYPGLEAQVNRLLMVAYSTALVISGTTGFTTTGYYAALNLLNAVHQEFTP